MNNHGDGGDSGEPPFWGKEVYLPSPSISGNIKPIELKTGLKLSHITTFIFYLQKSEKSMTSWIILLISAKKTNNFSDFYCISTAVANIILYVV